MGSIITAMVLVITTLSETLKELIGDEKINGKWNIIVVFVVALAVGLAYKPVSVMFPIPDGTLPYINYVFIALFSGGVAAGLWGTGSAFIKKIKK